VGALLHVSGETVAKHRVEVVAIEVSASGCLDVVLDSSVAISGTEGMTIASTSAAGSSVVA
jgi:hypothetical protein